MKKLYKAIFGNSPITSVVGYLLSGLMVLDEMLKSGETSAIKIGIAVFTAVLGRFMADANKTQSRSLDGPGGTKPPPKP